MQALHDVVVLYFHDTLLGENNIYIIYIYYYKYNIYIFVFISNIHMY